MVKHFTRSTFITSIFCLSTIFLFAQTSKKAIEEHKEHWKNPAWADTLKNPLIHVAWAADSGKVIYQRICSVCHGKSGKGDGVASAGLNVLPANHTSELVQMQTDGALYYELTNGHAPMPGYKAILTDKERWELIDYIRTLKGNNSAKH
jgi:cytochrome c